jgi:hypothetical protein
MKSLAWSWLQRRSRSRSCPEDSSNGLRSAAAAGTIVIAVPNAEFPPSDDALALADAVTDSLAELSPERLVQIGLRRGRGPQRA